MKKLIAMFRKLFKPLPPQRENGVMKVGESYRVPDGRKGHEGESNWVHSGRRS